MKVVQCNVYVIGTVDADDLVFSTRASVAAVLSTYPYVSSRLWVNIIHIVTYKSLPMELDFTVHSSLLTTTFSNSTELIQRSHDPWMK